MKTFVSRYLFAFGLLAAGCSSSNNKTTLDATVESGSDSATTTAHDSVAGDTGVATDSGLPTDSATSTATDAATATDSTTTKTDAATASDAAATEAAADTASADSDSAAHTDAGALWQPTSAGPIHFHWMIGGFATADILTNQNGPTVYDIDGEGATAADVAAIHAAGAKAVCYVDVGSLEQGRSDYSQFPSTVVGPVVDGWPQENWLLVTAANQATILPLMQARFENWCLAKGFDGIEPDNLDGWTNISGITEADNVAYDMAIAGLAHALSMSIGLKNVLTDVSGSEFTNFVSTFDWALNEQCFEYSECGSYTQAGSFIAMNKAVFDVEYNVQPTCTTANTDHLNAQFTDLDLVGATASGYVYTPCVADSSSVW